MKHPWKVGDQVFCRVLGEMKCSAHTITHIWPEQEMALLDTGDVIQINADLLTPPPAAAMRQRV